MDAFTPSTETVEEFLSLRIPRTPLLDRNHDGQRESTKPVGQKLEDLKRRRVGPMHVVEEEGEGVLLGGGSHEMGDFREQCGQGPGGRLGAELGL